LIFWTPPLGPFWRENGGIQGVFRPIPGQIIREFSFEEQGIFFAEQGIQFRGTGNSKRRNRNLRYERRDYAHRLQ
jgi:hypothetical protein